MRLAQDRWPSAFLGELCHIKIGKTPDRSNSEYWGSGHPWLSITDMQQGKDLVTTKETITQKAVDECRCYQIQPGTLLMSFKLSIGKLGFAKIPMYTNEAIAALQLKDQRRLSSDYLYYVLQAVNLTASVDRAVKGMTLNTDKLNVLSIPIPSLPKQKRITTILEKADRLRRLRRYALELSGTYLQSVFLEMFGDPITNSKDYPTIRLSEHIDLIGGYAFKSEDFVNNGIPVIRIGTVNTGAFNPANLVYLPEVFSKNYNRFLLYPGDLIITLTGTIGKDDYANICMLGNHFHKYFLNQRVAKITNDTHFFISEYILHVFRSPSIKRILTNPSRGIRQANISNDDILNLCIPQPPLHLQQKFAQIVQKYERLRAQQREAERQAEHLFQTLLHKAFQGELSLDEDEVLMPDVKIVNQRMPAFSDVIEPIDTVNAFQMALPME